MVEASSTDAPTDFDRTSETFDNVRCKILACQSDLVGDFLTSWLSSFELMIGISGANDLREVSLMDFICLWRAKSSFKSDIRQLVVSLFSFSVFLAEVIMCHYQRIFEWIRKLGLSFFKFIVESHFSSALLTFSKTFKAYHIIKIKLKPLFWFIRWAFLSNGHELPHRMWKLKFNFETNFLRFFKSDAFRLMMTAVEIFLIYLKRGGTNVKIIVKLFLLLRSQFDFVFFFLSEPREIYVICQINIGFGLWL